MSFVNFMCYGSSHPSFDSIHANAVVRTLEVTCNPSFDAHQESSQSIPFSLNFSPLDAASQTWQKFETITNYIRNGSALLSLASLATLYWKHIPANGWRIPFKLITSIAASALAGVALLAYHRKFEANSELREFPNKSNIVADIHSFRKYLLDPSVDRRADPLCILNANLHSKAFEFFSQKELFYLIMNVLFVKNGKISPLDIYYHFAIPTSLETNPTTLEGQVIKAYSAFRSRVDFDYMKKESGKLFHECVKSTVTDQIITLFNPDKYTEESDRQKATCLNNSYQCQVQTFYYRPGDDRYETAFEAVCEKIGLLRMDARAVQDYLTNTAFFDFNNALYEPGLVEIFRTVVDAVDRIGNCTDTASWLERQITHLADPAGKRVLEILELTKQKPAHNLDFDDG